MSKKKKTLDQRAAEKYAAPKGRLPRLTETKEAFLAGIRYARRADIAAVQKEKLLNAGDDASWRSEFWKGVKAGKTWAIGAIRKRARK